MNSSHFILPAIKSRQQVQENKLKHILVAIQKAVEECKTELNLYEYHKPRMICSRIFVYDDSTLNTLTQMGYEVKEIHGFYPKDIKFHTVSWA